MTGKENIPKAIPEKRRHFIKTSAIEFLIKQKPRGEYALCFMDYMGLASGGSIITDTIENFESDTGSVMSQSIMGIERPISDGTHLVLVRGMDIPREEVVMTVLHECGHALLSHSESNADPRYADLEADTFAMNFASPEVVLRYLDIKKGAPLTVDEMKRYFPLPEKYLKMRRKSIKPNSPFIPTKLESELLELMFSCGAVQ